MNFNRLQYFVEVVEAHSINKAAKKLLLTPSSLLTTINAMEKELSCTLLIRSHNGVTPTYAGRILYEDAKNILATEEKWQNFSLLNNDSIYHIEIGIVPGIQYSIMPELVVKCLQHTPPIVLVNNIITSLDVTNYITSHQCPILLLSYDQGAYSHILNLITNFNMQYELLESQRYYAFMNISHPLAKAESLILNDLDLSQMVAYNLDVTYNYKVKKLYSKDTLFINDLFYIFSILKHTERIAILPGLMRYAQTLSHNNITFKTVNDLPYILDHIIVYPKESLLTESTKQTINLIKDFFIALNTSTTL